MIIALWALAATGWGAEPRGTWDVPAAPVPAAALPANVALLIELNPAVTPAGNAAAVVATASVPAVATETILPAPTATVPAAFATVVMP